MQLVDSAPVEEGPSAEEAGYLGEIRVELYHQQALQAVENPSLNNDMRHIDKISEKALKGKAISHATRCFAFLFHIHCIFSYEHSGSEKTKLYYNNQRCIVQSMSMAKPNRLLSSNSNIVPWVRRVYFLLTFVH